MENEAVGRREALAKDILILSRNTLLVNLRFLDLALSCFALVPVPPLNPLLLESVAVDGAHKLQLIQARKLPPFLADADCKLTLYRKPEHGEHRQNVTRPDLRPRAEADRKLSRRCAREAALLLKRRFGSGGGGRRH